MLTPDELFQALDDPTRRRILALLTRRSTLCVCELLRTLNAPQPTVSRHLAALRKSALVAVERRGTWMHYRIHPLLPTWAYRVILAMLEAPGQATQLTADLAHLEASVVTEGPGCAG